jgi:hypothetical protein
MFGVYISGSLKTLVELDGTREALNQQIIIYFSIAIGMLTMT